MARVSSVSSLSPTDFIFKRLIPAPAKQCWEDDTCFSRIIHFIHSFVHYLLGTINLLENGEERSDLVGGRGGVVVVVVRNSQVRKADIHEIWCPQACISCGRLREAP